MDFSTRPENDGVYLIDSYRNFLATEGVPVYDGFSVDCLDIELEPWERVGGRGAYVHLAGRSEFDSMYVAEIAPGSKLKPERHMHEKLIFVFSGHGSTTVELPSGEKRSFEWGPYSMFSIPLNFPHQHFNMSGSEPARFAAVTNLPLSLNLYHSVDYVFDNPCRFPERLSDESYLGGQGTFIERWGGRHQWETNFVPDLSDFAELRRWRERGAGGTNIMFTIGDSVMHAHLSEFPVGTYKKAHRHHAGLTLYCLNDRAYTLLWVEGQDPLNTIRVDWRLGVVFAPPDDHYHQMFNLGERPARYLAMAMGGQRYPVLERQAHIFRVMDQDVKSGGAQIEYEDEDPRILELFRKELERVGVAAGVNPRTGEPL